MNDVIWLVVQLVVLGICLFLIENYIPMSPPITLVIRVLVVMFSILLLLSFVGIIHLPLRS